MPRSTAAPPTAPDDADVIFVSPARAAELLGLSRNHVYELLDSQRIESRYHGRKRMVLLSSVRSFAEDLPAYRPG